MRGYIYLISFDNTNYIYIGKTKQAIEKRFHSHKTNRFSAVYQYMKKNNIENAYIDIIDSIDMTEDLSYLNDKYDNYVFKLNNVNDRKLSCLEMFHIHNYIKDGKYKLLNKAITAPNDVLLYYDMFFF